MTTILVLAMLNSSEPFIIKIDAFRYGFGAILLQNQWLIASYGRPLGPLGRMKPIYKRN